jgi:hypothetical protein
VSGRRNGRGSSAVELGVYATTRSPGSLVGYLSCRSGYEYGGSINQIFHGRIGDIRIVNRPLKVNEFMIGK